MTDVSHHHADLGDVVLHYVTAGKGFPVVLLHSGEFGGCAELSWEFNLPALAAHFHVVAADLRGYGDSSLPDPGENHANYSFCAMAQDLLDVMDQLGYDTFFVAGHDRGGCGASGDSDRRASCAWEDGQPG